MNVLITTEAEKGRPAASDGKSTSRYESLTLWRGVACLMVVIYHSLFSGYGPGLPVDKGFFHGVSLVLSRFWIGVPLFFVISGYCVTASADGLRQRAGSGAEFFWRRFRRIYPPFWIWFGLAALCVYAVETWVQPSFFSRILVTNPADLTPWQWVGNLTLTETWRWRLTRGVQICFTWPLWTLCYEEQFYAVTGLVLMLTRRFLFQVFLLISVVVAAGTLLFPFNTEGLFLDGKWLMFAAGALVYFALNHVSAQHRKWFCDPLVLGIFCAEADPRQLLDQHVNEPSLTYLTAFCFAILLIGLKGWDVRLSTVRWLRPLRYCGEMCYSLYLVHWPLVTVVGWVFRRMGVEHPLAILFVTLPCCVVVALLAGWGFHLAVERRFWNRSPLNSPSSP